MKRANDVTRSRRTLSGAVASVLAVAAIGVDRIGECRSNHYYTGGHWLLDQVRG